MHMSTAINILSLTVFCALCTCVYVCACVCGVCGWVGGWLVSQYINVHVQLCSHVQNNNFNITSAPCESDHYVTDVYIQASISIPLSLYLSLNCVKLCIYPVSMLIYKLHENFRSLQLLHVT